MKVGTSYKTGVSKSGAPVCNRIYITLGEPPLFWLAKTARGLSSVAEQR